MPSISPVRWDPPPRAPFEGRFAANDRLAAVELWPTPAEGPEDVAADSRGFLYTGTVDGSILRFSPGGGDPELLFNTGGRPLGVEIDVEDRIVICDAHRGLLRWSGDSPELLVNSYEGEEFKFTNNAAVASDGTIYFTVSSRRFGIGDYKLDLIEHSGTGRLYALRSGGQLELLVEGLHFSNGVALSEDESFLVYAETGMYRLSKLWLTGARRGQIETLIENLPGFPDNLTQRDGIFWVALAGPRDKIVDILARSPILARLTAMLPDSLQPAPTRYAAVFGIGDDGTVIHNLQDPDGRYAVTTAALAHGDYLYLGSLHDSAVARIPLPV